MSKVEYEELIRIRPQLRKTRRALREMAMQLERWAIESEDGGWSTHQVKPMREKANELRKIADAEQ